MHHTTRIAALALLASLLPATYAASSAASSASDSVTTSVGSVSASFQRSSDSSTNNKVADGEYKVIEMAAVPDEAGKVRMKLQAMAPTTGDKEFVLLLPQEAVERGHVRVGGVITARTRDYGYEFASLNDDKPFFLVLADEWFKELQSRPVAL
jgi:guanyl-specific ribonuclease Sa